MRLDPRYLDCVAKLGKLQKVSRAAAHFWEKQGGILRAAKKARAVADEPLTGREFNSPRSVLGYGGGGKTGEIRFTGNQVVYHPLITPYLPHGKTAIEDHDYRLVGVIMPQFRNEPERKSIEWGLSERQFADKLYDVLQEEPTQYPGLIKPTLLDSRPTPFNSVGPIAKFITHGNVVQTVDDEALAVVIRRGDDFVEARINVKTYAKVLAAANFYDLTLDGMPGCSSLYLTCGLGESPEAVTSYFVTSLAERSGHYRHAYIPKFRPGLLTENGAAWLTLLARSDEEAAAIMATEKRFRHYVPEAQYAEDGRKIRYVLEET